MPLDSLLLLGFMEQGLSGNEPTKLHMIYSLASQTAALPPLPCCLRPHLHSPPTPLSDQDKNVFSIPSAPETIQPAHLGDMTSSPMLSSATELWGLSLALPLTIQVTLEETPAPAWVSAPPVVK